MRPSVRGGRSREQRPIPAHEKIGQRRRRAAGEAPGATSTPIRTLIHVGDRVGVDDPVSANVGAPAGQPSMRMRVRTQWQGELVNDESVELRHAQAHPKPPPSQHIVLVPQRADAQVRPLRYEKNVVQPRRLGQGAACMYAPPRAARAASSPIAVSDAGYGQLGHARECPRTESWPEIREDANQRAFAAAVGPGDHEVLARIDAKGKILCDAAPPPRDHVGPERQREPFSTHAHTK